MGRPTDYSDIILASSNEYLEDYEELGDAIPSIAGLAIHLKLSRTTLYDWAKHDDKKEFSYILDDILSKQENVLMNKGLLGEFNSNITKLALGKHGYSDKQDTNMSGQLDTQATYVPEVHRFDGSIDS